jgi:hypothetical protein
MHTNPLKALSQAGLLIPLLIAGTPALQAQMVTGERIPGYKQVFGLDEGRKTKAFTLEEIRSTPAANIAWPGEQLELAFRFVNQLDTPMDIDAHWDLIPYGTKSKPNDVWEPDLFALGQTQSIPLKIQAPAKGSIELTVRPPLPEKHGGFALVLEVPGHGRVFAATMARVPKPDPERAQFPTYALDMPWPHEISTQTYKLFQRLGVKGCRHGVGYFPTTSPDFQERWDDLAHHLREMQEHNITVLITIGEGGAPMPLGKPRPWLQEDGTMKEIFQADYAWLPEYDADFQKWCHRLAAEFGWPKGPVNAVELWNEPWEAVSISGWAADIPRFREIYENMALGIESGRKEGGTQVLIGGACSSTNTRDKLFPDGTDKFLKWLDFVSIHYQPLAADPALEPKWMTRKAPYGPVRVWDTESWIANSEDRIAGVIASMRSQGQSRTAGIYGGNVYEMQWNHDMHDKQTSVVQTWSPAVAVAAVQQFIGQREFRQILFTNGLPWIYVFDGIKSKDDGTLVVLGDLGAVYDRDRTLFRGVGSLKKSAFQAPKPGGSDDDKKLAASPVLQDTTLTLPDNNGEFVLFDFYGNPLPSVSGKITIPLNGLGYFLRTTGAKGSFDKLLSAVRKARIDGYEPVAFTACDFTRRPAQSSIFKITLVNILNRPITGTLTLTLDGCELTSPSQRLELKPNETRELRVELRSAREREDNSYALSARFDAGADGACEHKETLHANVTVRKTINVDGQLDDWKGALPLPTGGAGIQASLTEAAWLPFNKVDDSARSGLTIAYTAYDDNYFYFAAKVVDNSPYEGGPRFENRDDDSYFYPDKSYTLPKDGHKELLWPQGVRHFSYRRDFEIPSGVGNMDNIQIAFNVLPTEKKPLYSHPKGTMPHYMTYADTDYEFVFNTVAPQFGGGVETWCLLKPGMPRKHFFPRQPKSAIDGGPVKDAKLVMRREGNLRILEAALPWSAIPELRKSLDAGKTFKFSYRVNDNKGPANELAAGRSVSKINTMTFHCDWQTHWANELEFGFEKANSKNK